MTTPLQRTFLYDRHHALGARFVPFSGWEMPVQYQGVMAEHQAVRTQAGIFDISHMGKFVLRGEAVGSQLAHLVPTDLSKLPVGSGQYTVLLNPAGGILDDVIFYNQGADRWTVIVNAATLIKDRNWLEQHLSGVDLEDLSSSYSLLAVQGPLAVAALQPLLKDSLTDLKRFQHRWVTLNTPDAEVAFIARTGYTGEDGVEIMLSPVAGAWLWDQLLTAQVQPCGLGARDTLRLEAAMHLYGQDMDESSTPLEASLGWLVNSPADFIGKDGLEQQRSQGLTRQLVGLRMQGREIARHGYPIFAQDQQVGIITSGTKSPTLGTAIALGYVPPALTKIGTPLQVEIRGKLYAAEVVKRPFYRSQSPAPKD